MFTVEFMFGIICLIFSAYLFMRMGIEHETEPSDVLGIWAIIGLGLYGGEKLFEYPDLGWFVFGFVIIIIILQVFRDIRRKFWKNFKDKL